MLSFSQRGSLERKPDSLPGKRMEQVPYGFMAPLGHGAFSKMHQLEL